MDRQKTVLMVTLIIVAVISMIPLGNAAPAITFDAGSAKGCGPFVSSCSTLISTTTPGELLLMDARDDCGSQVPTVSDTSSTNWGTRFAGQLIGGTTYVTELWSITSGVYTNDNVTVSGCTGKWSFGIVVFMNVRISNPFAGLPITANSGGVSGGPNAHIVFTGLQSGEALHVMDACVVVSGNCSVGVGNPPTGFTVLIQDSVINTAYQVLTAGVPSLDVTWNSGTWYWAVSGDVLCPASGANCGGSQGNGCGTVPPFPNGLCNPTPINFQFQSSLICPLGNGTLSIGCYSLPSQLMSPLVPYIVAGIAGGALASTFIGRDYLDNRDKRRSLV